MTRRRIRWLLGDLAVLVVAFTLLAWAARPATHDTKPATPTTRCTEDMACWNCSTMGNRVCGPRGVEHVDRTQSTVALGMRCTDDAGHTFVTGLIEAKELGDRFACVLVGP